MTDEPYSWTHIPTPVSERWIAGTSFTYFVGSHNGYERLADPVIHRRHVLQIAGGVFLVRDVALGRAEHDLEIRWHFAPDLQVRTAGLGRVEISQAGNLPEQAALSLIVPEETVWQTASEVSRTLVSPAYGALQPAPLVRCHARVTLPAETATALVPHRAAIQQDALRLASMTQSAVQVYELDYHNQSQGFFFALGNDKDTWSFGPWSSDAQLLYCHIENEQLTHLIVIGGTQVAWQAKPLLKLAEKSSFFEWRPQDAPISAASGDFSVTPLFEELTGTHHSSSPFAEKH